MNVTFTCLLFDFQECFYKRAINLQYGNILHKYKRINYRRLEINNID